MRRGENLGPRLVNSYIAHFIFSHNNQQLVYVMLPLSLGNSSSPKNDVITGIQVNITAKIRSEVTVQCICT